MKWTGGLERVLWAARFAPEGGSSCVLQNTVRGTQEALFAAESHVHVVDTTALELLWTNTPDSSRACS